MACLQAALLCVAGCDSPSKDSPDVIAPPPNAYYPELEEPQPRPDYAEQIDFHLGAYTYRAPRDVVGFYVGRNGERVTHTTLKIHVPDLLGRDGAITRGNGVLISMTERDPDAADAGIFNDYPLDADQARQHFLQTRGQIPQEQRVDETLGLLRIDFPERNHSVMFARADDFRRPQDGRIPTAHCSGSHWSKGWPCTSYGFLPPDVKISYSFYPNALADWPAIDAAVFELIEGYRVADSL